MIALDGTSLHADYPRWQACDHPCYDVALIALDGSSLHADYPRWQACDHPCYDVAKGERLLKDVYEALRAWTSLIALPHCMLIAKGERLLKDVYEALRAWTR
jgi:hypothetical protein